MKKMFLLSLLFLVALSTQGCKLQNPFSANAETLPMQYKETPAYKTDFGASNSDRSYIDGLVPEVFNDETLSSLLGHQSDLHTVVAAMKYIEGISSRTQLRLLSDFSMNDFINIYRVSEGLTADISIPLAKIQLNPNTPTMNGSALCSRLMTKTKLEVKMDLKPINPPVTTTADVPAPIEPVSPDPAPVSANPTVTAPSPETAPPSTIIHKEPSVS